MTWIEPLTTKNSTAISTHSSVPAMRMRCRMRERAFMLAIVSPLASRPLREQAVDEALDVAGVDVAVTISVAGASAARCSAVEENVDEELDV